VEVEQVELLERGAVTFLRARHEEAQVDRCTVTSSSRCSLHHPLKVLPSGACPVTSSQPPLKPTRPSREKRLTQTIRETEIVYCPSAASIGAVPPDEPLGDCTRSSATEVWTYALITCPPSKPISIRILSSATAHQLCQNSVHGLRMHESDLHAE